MESRSDPLGRPVWRLSDLYACFERVMGAATAQNVVMTVLGAVDEAALPGADTPLNEAQWLQAKAQLVSFVGPTAAATLLEGGPQAEHSAPVVAGLLGDASARMRNVQALLWNTINNVSHALYVANSTGALIAWNHAFVRLFEFPPELVKVGAPLDRLLRWQADQVVLSPLDAQARADLWLEKMTSRTAYALQHNFPDGRCYRVEGCPTPDGLYVTSFTDVTDLKQHEAQLRENQWQLLRANDALEMRVKERTAELETARAAAESATRSKTRFLAAASHDVMQPLNAARLFNTALVEDLQAADASACRLATKVGQSIDSADRLLRTLLDISKLDAGGLRPDIAPFALNDLLGELVEEFAVVAAQKGLALKAVPTSVWLTSDRRLLRSVLQNFVSNAIKYSRTGGVLIGVRRVGTQVRVQVVDTGVGLAADKQSEVFREFHRIDPHLHSEETGLGLGLAIVERVAALLGATLGLVSQLGKGSCFSVTMGPVEWRPFVATMRPRHQAAAGAKHILCIDDDRRALEALSTVLQVWGHGVAAHLWSGQPPELAGVAGFDALVIDFNLGDGTTGFDVIDALRARGLSFDQVIVVSGEFDPELEGKVVARGHLFERKPVRPDWLRKQLA